MRVTYQGPFDAVEIAATGQIAKQGQPVDVPKDVGESLVEQGWKLAKKPAKKESNGWDYQPG